MQACAVCTAALHERVGERVKRVLEGTYLSRVAFNIVFTYEWITMPISSENIAPNSEGRLSLHHDAVILHSATNSSELDVCVSQ